MNDSDWSDVSSIYLEGIKTQNATFETAVPDWKSWDSGHLTDCRLVAVFEQQIAGWAALSPVSGRCIYSGVAEVSVYVSSAFQRRGIGMLLLESLITRSEKAGIWTLQAGIFPENEASIRMHEKAGFRIVGTREKLGRMQGRWRDVVLMERRSIKVGV